MRMGTSSYVYHHQQTRPSHNATLLYVTVSHMCYLCLYVAAACCAHVCLPVESRDQLAAAPSTT